MRTTIWLVGLLIGVAASLGDLARASIICTYDLRIAAADQSGEGAKTRVVALGNVVHLEVYAMIPNGDGLDNDAIATSSLRWYSNESGTGLVMGDLTNATKNPLFTLGTVGAQKNYDGNADMEWGGNITPPVTSTTGYFNPMNSAIILGHDVLLGTITWTCTSAQLSGQTAVNVAYYKNTVNGRGNFNVQVDGVAYAGSTISPADPDGWLAVGSPVVLYSAVPEPSTLLLATAGLAGLLAYGARRRR
jgi:hypothetical protein